MHTRKNPTRGWLVSLLVFLAATSAAFGHTGAGATHGFLHGVGHPIGGLDHILAMLAVGIWAAQLGGRAIWVAPLSFVGMMIVGGALGLAGMPLPFVEQGIVFSVVFLGIFIAVAVRMPVWAAGVVAGVFALFHGFAHGAEMPENASGLLYGVGFVLATAALHGVGIGIALFTLRIHKALFVRILGGCIAGAGAYLAFAG